MAKLIASLLRWISSLFVEERYKFSRRFIRDLEDLNKHNPDLEEDFKAFVRDFEKLKSTANRVRSTKGAYKVRMKSSGKGKSGSYRIIYFSKPGQTWFLTMYAKNDKPNLSPQDEKDVRKMVTKIKGGEEI